MRWRRLQETNTCRHYTGSPKLCNENPKQSTRVLDKNRNLLNKKEEVQARWTEHFKELLKRGEPENPVLSDEVYAESELCDIIEEILYPIHTN